MRRINVGRGVKPPANRLAIQNFRKDFLMFGVESQSLIGKKALPKDLTLTFSPEAWLKMNYLLLRAKHKIMAVGVTSPDDLMYVTDLILLKQYNSVKSVRFDQKAWQNYLETNAKLSKDFNTLARVLVITTPDFESGPDDEDDQVFSETMDCFPFAALCVQSRNFEVYCRLRLALGHIDYEQEVEVEVDSTDSLLAEVNQQDWNQEYEDFVNVQFKTLKPEEQAKTILETAAPPDPITSEEYFERYFGFFARDKEGRDADLAIAEKDESIPWSEIQILRHLSEQISLGLINKDKFKNKKNSDTIETIAISPEEFLKMEEQERLSYMLYLGEMIDEVDDVDLCHEIMNLKEQLRVLLREPRLLEIADASVDQVEFVDTDEQADIVDLDEADIATLNADIPEGEEPILKNDVEARIGEYEKQNTEIDDEIVSTEDHTDSMIASGINILH
jgi:hypothetical protein